ncbi:DUF695 domain-containing protein [Bremerella sp. JC770]|uniref:DUF695 domain-containing protein n=1 Tax=Bremerella sp. JC770 TaxID=3232137 RepID=UPI003458ED1F
MSENWNAYLTQIKDSIASVLIDMGAVTYAPDAQRTWLIRVAIVLHHPDEHGMTSNEEFAAIQPLEEAIVDAIQQRLDAVNVGCMTYKGQRVIAFYSPTSDGIDVALAPVIRVHDTYELKNHAQVDADWGFYFNVLYPSPYENQSMQNSSVLRNLVEHGDTLAQERPVSHWAYFPSDQARAQFNSAVQAKGFQIEENREREGEDQPNRFGIRIERVDHVDQASIDQVTIELYELAKSLDGDYDGWETMVVTGE